MPNRKRPVAERFWERVDVAGPDDCWLWTRGKHSDGYGRMDIGNNTNVGAHRISWELHHGPIPPNMYVCHRCDNPPCVNPAHLFLGTIIDNVVDRDAKGRTSMGEKHCTAKLTSKQVREIFVASGKHKEIAINYGVTRSTVTHIKNARSRASETMGLQ